MKFISWSLLILAALYGLVFAMGDLYLAKTAVPIWISFIFAVGLIGIQFLIAPMILEWILDIKWENGPDEPKFPQEAHHALQRICDSRRLRVPRLGVISSGTPNAFSFGHIPSDARIVVTTGLIEILTPAELDSVLAHELGHVEHWDFAVMSIAALAPLLLYQLYSFTRTSDRARVIAYGAYAAYLVSRFIVLLLNRTREYFADHYSSEVTGTPDVLSSALVKIAYGMVRSEGEFQQNLRILKGKPKRRLLRQQRLAGSMGLMGISNINAGAALVLGANPQDAAAVMRWDLVNPWARLYELNSTHPLTALRIRALNRGVAHRNQTPQYPLPQDQRIRWGFFPFEVVLWAAPVISGFLLFSVMFLGWRLHVHPSGLPPRILPELLMFTGAAWIVRTWCRYRGEFQPAQIGTLLKDEVVSQMCPRAVQVTGEILGRGVPGAFWSADLVVRDATGMLFVLYRQSIPFARLLFALSAAEELTGTNVEIEGWFRRGLRPYIEMSRLTTDAGRTYHAYSRWVQYALAAAAVTLGWIWRTA